MKLQAVCDVMSPRLTKGTELSDEIAACIFRVNCISLDYLHLKNGNSVLLRLNSENIHGELNFHSLFLSYLQIITAAKNITTKKRDILLPSLLQTFLINKPGWKWLIPCCSTWNLLRRYLFSKCRTTKSSTRRCIVIYDNNRCMPPSATCHNLCFPCKINIKFHYTDFHESYVNSKKSCSVAYYRVLRI
jgi:hypothetical protein